MTRQRKFVVTITDPFWESIPDDEVSESIRECLEESLGFPKSLEEHPELLCVEMLTPSP
jgi:hypothetical protein